MAKIWIVEDDPKIGMLIEMTMRKAGHETQRMLDAAEMEKVLRRDPPPDLLLLDLMLREKMATRCWQNGSSAPLRRRFR